MIRVPKRVHQVSLSLLPAPLPLESFVPIPGHGYGIDQPGWQFDPYWSGSRCFVRQENWFSIDDETGYVNYWRRNVSTSVPGLDLDWDRYRLVAIHLGSRPTTGFEIRVDGIDRLPDGTARIRVIEERSTRLSDLRPISTSPFVVIKVERDLPSFTIELTKKGN
jgi:hypothetical protein